MSTSIPEQLRYAKTHEWVRLEGNVAVIGISDHAQRELTDIVFVELPKVGREVKAGDACVVIESVKTAADVYSPVSGTIIEVNTALSSDPGLVNRDPYGAGWLFKVQVSDPKEVDLLLDSKAYAQHIGA
jgi:glycine cleavage system H protein